MGRDRLLRLGRELDARDRPGDAAATRVVRVVDDLEADRLADAGVGRQRQGHVDVTVRVVGHEGEVAAEGPDGRRVRALRRVDLAHRERSQVAVGVAVEDRERGRRVLLHLVGRTHLGAADLDDQARRARGRVVGRVHDAQLHGLGHRVVAGERERDVDVAVDAVAHEGQVAAERAHGGRVGRL